MRRSATLKERKPAGLFVPSSATSLTEDTTPERPRLSAKEKGKGKATATTFDESEAQHPTKHHHSLTEKSRDHHHDQTSKLERSKITSGEKGKAKAGIQEQSHVPRTSNQQHSPDSRQPAAEKGVDHQCDWKDKYNTLKAEFDDGRQMQGLGVAEASDEHKCDWKEKYLALQRDAEENQDQQADLGLEGLTIVLHMRGKDDLVINTDLRQLDQR